MTELNALTGRRIAVTGGAGFLGRAVVAELTRHGCPPPFVPRSADYDLTTEEGVDRFLADAQPDLIIHLAARVGGIGAHDANPGAFLYDNLMMGALLIERARRRGVGRFVCVGSICSYPAQTAVPFREEDLWEGYPAETTAPYGLAKKLLLVQLQAYRRQYGMDGIYLMPVNLYGPHDNFDPETSHVIPALIRRCSEARDAGRDVVTCWGTGVATREFLYVDDCAVGIVRAAALYDGPEPVNLGSGQETSIRDLTERIGHAVGFTGRFEWDASKPDGQPRVCLDTRRARDGFGFEARVGLDDGLARTSAWYEASMGSG
ncbi:MAG: GDP-L-fucose synthase [Acidobacteriota bacterium]|nr:GDP-L-fucose synthase [Acidobacteriota bacterium]